MSFTVAKPGQTAAMNVSEAQGVFVEKPFGKALIEVGRARPEIVALTADLGKYTDIDIFGHEFPARYFQTGMAEQNLVGIAAGLAHTGFVPFATTYCVFATRRAYDFIAIDIAYARANVKIIAGLPGLTTGYGATHQGIDDLALMRALPGMVVIDPCDATEIAQAVPAIAAYAGPVYMRLLRGKVPQILDPATHRFEIGKAFSLRQGGDLTLVSTGLMTGRALEAAAALAAEGVTAGVLHVPTLKPLDEPAILHAAKETGAILTLENHTVIGGLGSAVADTLRLHGVGIRMAKVGIQDCFVECGSIDYLADKHGLSTRRIIEAARALLEEVRVKITRLETFLCNAGLRNYLFLRLHTDTGLTGIGEASLEWQEDTVRTVIHEFLEERYVLGANPFDIEDLVGRMLRDQYQGGSTIFTAISGVEIALWDLVGKACGQPVYKLLGGRCQETLPAYANGWYGGARTPEQYGDAARECMRRGYRGVKFDPFGVSWKQLSREEFARAVKLVEGVRVAAGEQAELMIEGHGRFNVETALEMARALEPYRPAWFEEPVSPDSIDLLAEVSGRTPIRIAAGERLYTVPDFFRLASRRAAAIVQPDIAHCGGILTAKKIAAIVGAQDLMVAPHCSIGPVALAAALHFDVSTPNFLIQETFSQYDVPWRAALVKGWDPLHDGRFELGDTPGLGLELDEATIAAHPYVKNAFPSLWDRRWFENFTQASK